MRLEQKLLKQVTSSWNTPRATLYVSAVLMSLSLNVQLAAGLLALVSAGLLVLYVTKLPQAYSRRTCIDFFVYGCIVTGSGFSVIFDVVPSNWLIALPHWYSVAMQIITWLIVATICSTPYIILYLLLIKISKYRWRVASLVLSIPLLEIVRAYIFAIIAYGPGGTISPDFSLGSYATVAVSTPLVFASRIIGFYGLSAVVILLAITIISLRKPTAWSVSTICLVIFLSILGWQLGNKHGSHNIQVTAVHLQEQDAMDYWQNFGSIPDKQDVIVLPEYSGATSGNNFPKLAAKLKNTGLGVTSVPVTSTGRTTNEMLYFNDRAHIIDKQAKTFLIPSGETMPFVIANITKLVGRGDIVRSFEKSQRIWPGATKEKPQQMPGGVRVGGLICSGVMSLTEYRNISHLGADVLTNSASLSFVESNSRIHITLQRMARYQAVANQKPFIQSSRSGRSLIYSSQGVLLAEHKQNKTGVITAMLEY